METDLEMLKDPKISGRKRTALTNRVGQKQILNANLNILNILMRILARFQGGNLQQLKYTYMTIVEDFEKPEEVMTNRLKLRRYLRELILNQTRLYNASKEAESDNKNPTKPIPSDLIPYFTALDKKLLIS